MNKRGRLSEKNAKLNLNEGRLSEKNAKEASEVAAAQQCVAAGDPGKTRR